MAELGETEDPKALIPGNAVAVGATARSLRARGNELAARVRVVALSRQSWCRRVRMRQFFRWAWACSSGLRVCGS